MKISSAIAILAFIVTPAFASEKLHLDVLVGGEAQSFSFDLPLEHAVFSASTMKAVQFSPTSGDCSKFDTSQLLAQYPSGLDVKVAAGPQVEGKRVVQISLVHSDFLGASSFQFSKSCAVNNARGERYEGANTVVLTKGGTIIQNLVEESQPKARSISIKVVWK